MRNLKKSACLLAVMTIFFLSPVASQAQGDKKSSAILEAMSNRYQKIKSFKALFTYISKGEKPLKGEASVKGSKFRLKLAS